MNNVSVGAGKWTTKAGKLILDPADIVALQTPGSKEITVIATGYEDSTVTQNIATGALAESKSSVNPTHGNSPRPGTGFFMVLTAKDKYGNPLQNYQFKFDIEVNNSNSTNSESITYYNQSYTESTSNVQPLPNRTDNNGESYISFQWGSNGDSGDSTKIVWKDKDGNEIFTPTIVSYQ